MHAHCRTSMKARVLVALALLAAIGATVATDLRAATISIQPNRLTRMYNLQSDVQSPWRAQSERGMTAFSYELAVPVGRKITGVSYVHECPLPAPDPCGTSVGIWQVKASDPSPLRMLYFGSWNEYSMGLWVQASKIKDADIVVRSGWRYYVGVTCSETLSMVGEVRVTWQ